MLYTLRGKSPLDHIAERAGVTNVKSFRNAPPVSVQQPPKAALQTAIEQTKATVFTIPSLPALEDEQKKLDEIRSALFACEHEAMAKVDKKLSAVNEQISHARMAAQFNGKYLPLNHNCLKWRNEQGFPKLMLFSLNEPETIIQYADYKLSFSHWMPEILKPLYEDMADTLKQVATEKFRHSRLHIHETIRAKFSGVIPPEIRQTIRQVMADKTFKDIYLVGEAQFTRTSLSYELPVRRDPIVAGWDGRQLWYIADFDTTPVEEAALLQGL